MPAINLAISGTLALIAGILILIWPKILRLALGFYLIIIGIISLIS